MKLEHIAFVAIAGRDRRGARSFRAVVIVMIAVDHATVARTHGVGDERHVQRVTTQRHRRHGRAEHHPRSEACEGRRGGPGTAGFTMTSHLRRCCS